jgi:ubiquinone/menaquinone biosynthesis C-methylase UbiE
MGVMQFDNEMGRVQRALAQCHDLVQRRVTAIQALNPRVGEHILEVGCGGGFYAFEVARAVGESGRMCGIDISADQITAARERCAGLAWVEFETINILDVPYADASFDAVYGVQVFEYIAALDEALRQVSRVLRPGGRLLISATNWNSMVWHSNEPQRMKRLLDAWNQHCPYPDLPSILLPRLKAVGLLPIRQQPIPLLNNSHHQNSFSYWASKLIKLFVVGQGFIDQAEADAWSDEFDQLEQQGAYFCGFMPILTEAIKVS